MINKTRQQFIPTLHGLRGFMAVWVLLFHTSPQGFGPLQFTKYGYLAVDIFFVLSGYVLMHGQSSRPKLDNVREVSLFLRARWWRVFPLYLVSVILSIILYWLVYKVWPDSPRIFESLFILDGWAKRGIGMNSAVWSLGVEWLGYFVFPAIVYGSSQLSNLQRFVVLVVISLGVTAYMSSIGDGWDQTVGLPAVIRMMVSFVGGCIIYTLRAEMPRWFSCQDDFLAVIAFLGLFSILFLGLPLFILPMIFLIVYALAQPGPWSIALLGSKVPLFLGRISFALYITHQLVIKAIVGFTELPQSLIGKVVGTTLAIGCSVVVATFLCRLIEEPVRRWSRSKG